MQIPSDMVLQEAIAALPADRLDRLMKEVEAEAAAAALLETFSNMDAPYLIGAEKSIEAVMVFGIVVGLKAAEIMTGAEPNYQKKPPEAE
jgi:hypothetical protein